MMTESIDSFLVEWSGAERAGGHGKARRAAYRRLCRHRAARVVVAEARLARAP